MVEGFSDANWNTMLGDFLITIGYILTLGSGLLLWKKEEEKKPIIANSTMETIFSKKKKKPMETKLITFASVSEEVNRLRYLLYEIPN